MHGILADVNLLGQFQALLLLLESKEWRDFWASLSLTVHTFESLELPFDATDRQIWETCQEREVVFITGNRNRRGEDSLEEALRTLNTPDSLPVLTVGDLERFRTDRTYQEQVAERLIDYLMRIDNLRGVGRLYIP